jgi:hypothetical protein
MDHEVKQLRDFCLKSKRFFVHVYCHIHTSSKFASILLLSRFAACGGGIKEKFGDTPNPGKGLRPLYSFLYQPVFSLCRLRRRD